MVITERTPIVNGDDEEWTGPLFSCPLLAVGCSRSWPHGLNQIKKDYTKEDQIKSRLY